MLTMFEDPNSKSAAFVLTVSRHDSGGELERPAAVLTRGAGAQQWLDKLHYLGC